MRREVAVMVLLAAVVCSGCRTATRMTEEMRVDLDIPEGGNRGYLIGTPPQWEGPRHTVRKMVEMEIETPPIWKPARPPAQESAPTPPARERLTDSGESETAPVGNRSPYVK